LLLEKWEYSPVFANAVVLRCSLFKLLPIDLEIILKELLQKKRSPSDYHPVYLIFKRILHFLMGGLCINGSKKYEIHQIINKNKRKMLE